jgi:hypothetical protein
VCIAAVAVRILRSVIPGAPGSYYRISAYLAVVRHSRFSAEPE